MIPDSLFFCLTYLLVKTLSIRKKGPTNLIYPLSRVGTFTSCPLLSLQKPGYVTPLNEVKSAKTYLWQHRAYNSCSQCMELSQVNLRDGKKLLTQVMNCYKLTCWYEIWIIKRVTYRVPERRIFARPATIGPKRWNLK